MHTLRLCARIALIVPWTLGLWGLRLLVWPLAWVDDRRDRAIRRRLVRWWARGATAIAGMRVEAHGAPPSPPFYLVANHLSYMDIFLLQRETGCTFVARGDMAAWPVIGWITKSLQVIFVDRERRTDAARVNETVRDALERGEGLTVFAESRITRGRAVDPFKSALIEPAVRLGIPVHYATIHYAAPPGGPPASTLVGWWRPEPLLRHMARLLGSRGFTATIHFGGAPLRGGDRKRLAEELTAAVRGRFRPVE